MYTNDGEHLSAFRLQLVVLINGPVANGAKRGVCQTVGTSFSVCTSLTHSDHW